MKRLLVSVLLTLSVTSLAAAQSRPTRTGTPAVRYGANPAAGHTFTPRRREALLRGLWCWRAPAARARQRRQHRRPQRPDRSLPQALQGDRDGQPGSGQVRRQSGQAHLREDDRRPRGAARPPEDRAGQRARLE